MSLHDAMTHVREIADATGLRFSKRKLRTVAVGYLDWWNGLDAKTTAHADPTGEAAIRHVLRMARA